jgi:hypothetical protein
VAPVVATADEGFAIAAKGAGRRCVSDGHKTGYGPIRRARASRASMSSAGGERVRGGSA